MGQTVEVVFFDECRFEDGESPDFDHMIVVCPDTGVLIQAVNWHSKGVVNVSTYESIDFTKVSQYYGLRPIKG